MSKLGKDILTYGVIDLVARTIGLITSPITTRLLTLGQYGAGPMLSALWAPLALLQFGGMDSAYPFFKAKTDDPKDAERMLVTATYVSNFFMFLLWGIFSLFALHGVWLSKYAEVSELELLLFVLSILPSGLMGWMLYVLRYKQEAKLFAKITITSRILPALFIIPLMMSVVQPNRLLVSWGATLVIQILAVFYSLYAIKKAGISLYSKSDFSFPLSKKMLKYGLFLAPAFMIYSMTNVVDRILVGWYMGPEFVGLLQLAMAVGGVAMMLSSWFGMAFDPHLIDWIGKKKIKEYVPQLQNLIHLLAPTFFGMACGAAVWSEWLFYYVYPMDYLSSAKVVPLLIFAGAFAVMSRIGIATILIADQPRKQLYVYAIAFFINLAVGIVLIPSLGIQGAIWGTICAEIFILSSWIFLGLKIYKNLQISWKMAYLMAFAACIFILFYDSGDVGASSGFMRAIIATIIIATLYFSYLWMILGKATFCRLLRNPLLLLKQ